MNHHDARVPVPANAPGHLPEQPAPHGAAVRTPAAPAPVGGLTVGHADDPAEHLADRMADTALERLRRSADPEADDSSAPGQHAHTPGCGHLRRAASSAPSGAVVGREGGALDEATVADVETARSGGSPLPTAVRRRMEAGFGTGLGHVRVHDGPKAARLSASMGAEAFTTGRDIFFGAGRFAPDTPEGEQVLAHEIAHVIAEPAGVRRFWNPFKKKTQEEKDAEAKKKAEEAAEAARIKKEKAERAAHAKAGKALVKQQRREDKERRRTGEAGRAKIAESQMGPGGGATANVNYARFDEALARERELIDQYVANGTYDTDEEAAEAAYHMVWYIEFPDLNAAKPAREKEAEKLTRQVRQTRTGAGAEQAADDADTETLGKVMLPSDIEAAYERMVRYRDELLAIEPGTSVVVAETKAWQVIRSTLPKDVIAGFPQRFDPLDVAAWEQAEARVAAREAKKSRDAKAAKTALALLPEDQRGTPQPEPEEESTVLETGQELVSQGGEIAEKIGEIHDDGISALAPETPTVEDVPLVGPVLGSLSGAIEKGKAVGAQKPKVEDAPEPPGAADGIGHVTGILNGLMSAATSAKAMVTSVRKAWQQDDPYEGLEASKAGANSLDGLVSSAKGAANLAKMIDGTVASGVESVLPGFDIVGSVTSMVRGVAEVAAAGMRQRETDTSLFEARVATGEKRKIQVSVYPLMKISQVFTKNLEKACWALGVAVVSFGASVAQIATAGGMGIPAAIKAATTLADKLHDLGHYIADKVLATMAKRAETESSVQHLEGAAEEELRKHPKMAVDGIIVQAAKGDPIALLFLSNYRIDGKPITEDYVKQIKVKKVGPQDVTPKKADPRADIAEAKNDSEDALLIKIREVVFAGMNTDADPQTVFDDLRAQVESKTGTARGIKESWDETGELADQRNSLAKEGRLGGNTKSDRGIGWRFMQMLSSKRRSKLKQKTDAFGAQEVLPDGVALAVGDQMLRDDAMPYEITEFAENLTIEDIEAEFKRTPRRNSPEWMEFLHGELMTKLAEQAKAAVGVGA